MEKKWIQTDKTILGDAIRYRFKIQPIGMYNEPVDNLDLAFDLCNRIVGKAMERSGREPVISPKAAVRDFAEYIRRFIPANSNIDIDYILKQYMSQTEGLV